MKLLIQTIVIGLSFLIFSCNLEKEIEFELPPHESLLMVEAYLEPGKPYRLLLTETLPYLAIPDTLPFVNNATVVISVNGNSDTLVNGLFVDFETEKFYNYGSGTIVTDNPDQAYTLSIDDGAGRIANSASVSMSPIQIDSLKFSYSAQDTAASVQTWFFDPETEDNFYRFTLNRKQLTKTPKQDFTTDDRFFEGKVVFGSGFDFKQGDTVISTLFHIDEQYHDFLETFLDAQDSNGNPFVQPSQIKTNIDGGTGIFTTLNFVRDSLIIQ